MATSSILGGSSSEDRPGHGSGALGYSDSSDSGSDLVGAPGVDEETLDDESDRNGTGEGLTVGGVARRPDDVTPDHLIETADDAGDAGSVESLDDDPEADDALGSVESIADDDTDAEQGPEVERR